VTDLKCSKKAELLMPIRFASSPTMIVLDKSEEVPRKVEVLESRTSGFEPQIAFILRQADEGTLMEKFVARPGSAQRKAKTAPTYPTRSSRISITPGLTRL
jgi:hypothetical protein